MWRLIAAAAAGARQQAGKVLCSAARGAAAASGPALTGGLSHLLGQLASLQIDNGSGKSSFRKKNIEIPGYWSKKKKKKKNLI